MLIVFVTKVCFYAVPIGDHDVSFRFNGENVNIMLETDMTDMTLCSLALGRKSNFEYFLCLHKGTKPFCSVSDLALPRGVLPAHYFDELSDDLDLEIEDEDFLNTTAEMERQYFLNQSKDSGDFILYTEIFSD